MKKLIILTALALCFYKGFTQSLFRPAFQKGSFFTGADLAIGWGSTEIHYDYENLHSTAFTLAPRAAWFIFNGAALGVALDYTAGKFKGYLDASSTGISAGPLIRIYSPDGFFINSSMTFGKMINELDNTTTQKFNIGIGYVFPLGELAFIEPLLLYRNTKMKNDDKYSPIRINEFAVAVGLGIYLKKKS